ncbi:MAG: alpha/beta hydrolase [Desulfotignum sp.]|nr:alpha/beta hydrolase [Desulfotignum sp.]
MKPDRFEIDTPDHRKLACMRFVPTVTPKAVVHIYHGMGEHKERYLPFMGFLAEHGYVAVAHDHRNHGQSVKNKNGPGLFTATDTWDRVVHDAFLVTRASRELYPDLDTCILGHSMGSVILRRVLFTYPDAADKAVIMATVPPYTFAAGSGPLALAGMVAFLTKSTRRSKFLAQALNKPLLKKYKNPRTPFDWLTHDEKIVDQYINDPLCGYAYTPKFYVEFFKGIINLHQVDRIRQGKNIPLLFICGTQDPVGNFGQGVKEVVSCYEKAGFNQITLELVAHARHEVLNEHNSAQTYETILNWLDQAGRTNDGTNHRRSATAKSGG